ncbi:MAG: hypothetical protein WDW38_011451 [Sanguina aurantia]
MAPKGKANAKGDDTSRAASTGQARKRTKLADLTVSKRPSPAHHAPAGGAGQELRTIEDLQQWAHNEMARLNASLERDFAVPFAAAIKVNTVTHIASTVVTDPWRRHTVASWPPPTSTRQGAGELVESAKQSMESARAQHEKAVAAVANAQTETARRVDKDRKELLAELNGGGSLPMR